MLNENTLKQLEQILKNAESYQVRSDKNKRDIDVKVLDYEVPIALGIYQEVPSRTGEANVHGGFLVLATGVPLDSVIDTDIVVTKGIGKLVIIINAGSDLDGTITVSGDIVDRNTGVVTGAQTNVITVDALTTDNSVVDSNGHNVFAFEGAYITSDWFTGTVTLSTTNLTLTDVDVYHVSFEQWNDLSGITLNTFDANIFTLGTNAQFDAYLHTLHVTGDKCNIDSEAGLHVGLDGETAIADKYWRLRRGNINEPLNGETDGFWFVIHYANNPILVEDVTVKVWATLKIRNKLVDVVATLISDLKKQKILN